MILLSSLPETSFSLSYFRFVGMTFPTLTLCMIVYAFIGWFYESTIFSLAEQGKFMNRGCFIGPYCPIYAVVPLFSLYLLQGIDSPFKIFFLSALVTCLIEYVTSYALEKLFHARYWDYSYYPLNINGRISVISGAFFGVAILFMIKVLHPFTLYYVSMIPGRVQYYLACAIWIIFLCDAAFTTISMCNLNKKCKEIYDAWDNYVEGKLDTLNEKKDKLNRFKIVRSGKRLVVKMKGVNSKFVDLESRFLKVYPIFKSTTYSELIEKIKVAASRKKIENVDDDDNDKEDSDKEDSDIDDEKLDGNVVE